MKKEPVKSKPDINKKNDDIVEEQPWINQNITWNFSLSMPRWMWILLSLFLISLVFLIN